MKTITKKCRITEGNGIFHNSRADVRLLASIVNTLIDTVNELIEAENNRQKEVNK